MTRRAARPCAGSPLCPELVTGTLYCKTHATQREAARGTPTQRGYDKAWRTTRATYLTDHPQCEACGATEETSGMPLDVHHLDGKGPLGPRGHDHDNLQTLCHVCHSRTTALETGTAGGPHRHG